MPNSKSFEENIGFTRLSKRFNKIEKEIKIKIRD
jgi:hypothetical protein